MQLIVGICANHLARFSIKQDQPTSIIPLETTILTNAAVFFALNFKRRFLQ